MVTILSVPRRPEAARLMRSRFRSETRWQPAPMAELQRDRLALILILAERAGIQGTVPELLCDPRLVTIIASQFRVPSPTDEACRRYYRDHQEEFCKPDRYLGRQIVLQLATGDIAAEPEVWARAERIIAILSFSPGMFADLLVSYDAAS